MPSHPNGWASGTSVAAPAPAAAPTAAQPTAPRPGAPATAPTPVGVGEVVAASAIQVNNHFLTVDDICRGLRGRLKELPPKQTEEAFRQQIGPWVVEEIHSQITRSLVLEEANKRLTDEQKKLVDAEVKEAENDMLVEANGSKTALKEKLRREGTTLEEALTEHRERAGYKLYLHNRFTPAIIISRQMLWDYYCQNREGFASDKKVQMQIIAAPFGRFMADDSANPSALERSAARRKAQEVITEAAAAVKKGEDFGEVAKRLSKDIKAGEGGVWPAMALGSFREAPVEQAAFQLLQGQVAGPIETEHGFYLVKAYKVQSGRVVPFEEAQDKISDTLRDRMYREQTEAYFKTLIEKAHIVQSDRFVQMTLDRAVAKFWNKL
jgi:parvulin-like peptidyl-prolyl isomerase